jgi:large subunit ribosomal protein L29
MKAREVRDLTLDEVLLKKDEVQKELFNLRLRQATRQIDNPLKMRLLRRDLARLNTIVHEHKLNIRTLAEGASETKDRQAEDEKQA